MYFEVTSSDSYTNMLFMYKLHISQHQHLQKNVKRMVVWVTISHHYNFPMLYHRATLCHGPLLRKQSRGDCRGHPDGAAKSTALLVEKSHTCPRIQSHKMCIVFSGSTPASLF